MQPSLDSTDPPSASVGRRLPPARNAPACAASQPLQRETTLPAPQSTVSMKDLLTNGVHFGHQTRRWNPKMKPFIFGERGGIYIIDLQKTTGLIDEAYAFLKKTAERGGTVLFVGTKKQCQEQIKEQAERVGMPYVNNRWLGGLLTNFATLASASSACTSSSGSNEDGSLDLLPTREAMQLRADLRKLEQNLGGVGSMERLPDGRLRRRPAQRGDRRQGGAQAQDPDRRARRHQLRPRRDRLRHPGQRRRHPHLRSDRPRHGRRRGRGPSAAHRGRDEGRRRAQGGRRGRDRRGRRSGSGGREAEAAAAEHAAAASMPSRAAERPRQEGR